VLEHEKNPDENITPQARCGSVWWYKPIIPTLRRLRQENFEFKASPTNTMSFRPAWVI
jgi:hypothetical protein